MSRIVSALNVLQHSPGPNYRSCPELMRVLSSSVGSSWDKVAVAAMFVPDSRVPAKNYNLALVSVTFG